MSETFHEDPSGKSAPEDASNVGDDRPRMSETLVSTGIADVDAVLVSLAVLDSTPIQEQVAIFESAHDDLRAALAGTGSTGHRPSPDNRGR